MKRERAIPAFLPPGLIAFRRGDTPMRRLRAKAERDELLALQDKFLQQMVGEQLDMALGISRLREAGGRA